LYVPESPTVFPLSRHFIKAALSSKFDSQKRKSLHILKVSSSSAFPFTEAISFANIPILITVSRSILRVSSISKS
jgi:hypothetical protein